MTIAFASLADGQVATTTGTLYTVPGATTAVLRSVTFFNTNATDQTINVYVTRSGGTRRQLRRFTPVVQYGSVDLLVDGEVLILSTGDVLEADTTTTTAVDYLITGATDA